MDIRSTSEVTITLTGTPSEFREMAENIRQWKPSGGWSVDVEEFLAELEMQ